MATGMDRTEMNDLLRLTARMSGRVTRLPAVPVSDWADHVARMLLGIESAAVAAAVVAEVTPDGSVRAVETTGVSAGGEASDGRVLAVVGSRLGRLTSLGFEPRLDASGTQLSAMDDTAGRAWRQTPIARAFEDAQPAAMAVGLAGLGKDRYLIVAIATVGASVHTPAVLGAVLPGLRRRAMAALGTEKLERTGWLTACEQQVLGLLVEGMSVKQIAQEIDRSPHTVHDHVKSLHRKLRASSRGELVARALGHVGGQDEDDDESATQATASRGTTNGQIHGDMRSTARLG